MTAGRNLFITKQIAGSPPLSLWSWGRNDTGFLGLGNATNTYSSPKQVGLLTDWAQVYAGNFHTAAVKTDGTLWTWGNGGNGRLGHGNTTSYSSPKQVGASTTWVKAYTGNHHTCGLKQ